MISCPHCNASERQVKCGMHGARQRYKCMSCGRKYIPDPTPRGYSDELKQRAIQMRAANMTIAEIAAVLNVHARSIVNWTRSAGASDIRSVNRGVRGYGKASLGTQATGSLEEHVRQNTGKNRSTIDDVARIAKVSTSTISNYINNTGRMSEATAVRIREVMDDLNFAPNALMRGLRQKSTGIIGVYTYGLDRLNEKMGESLTPPLLAGINHMAGSNGRNLLYFTGWELSEYAPKWQQFIDGHIDGLIWVSPHPVEPSLKRIASAGLPVIALLSRHVPDGVGYINYDNIGAIRSLVEHLASLGHTRIAYAGRVDGSNFMDRHEGYRLGLEVCGLPVDPDLEAIGTVAFWYHLAFGNAVDKWLELRDPPTALVIQDDRVAMFMIEALRQRGLSVPGDISVTGFDDIPDAQSCNTTGLTTVNQDFKRLGELAVEALIRLIHGVPVDQSQIILSAKTIYRGSTGPRAHQKR